MGQKSPLSESYESLWSTELAIRISDTVLAMDLGYWINDGLMGLFFFVIGLKVRRELSWGSSLYSSVGSAYRHTGIHHFESKRRIEEHLRTKELPCTILRLVFFIHSWDGMRQQSLSGTFLSPLSPETKFVPDVIWECCLYMVR